MRVRPAELRDRDALVAMRVALWPDGTAEEHRADVDALLAGVPRSTLPLVDAELSVLAHEALGYEVVERLVCFHKKL